MRKLLSLFLLAGLLAACDSAGPDNSGAAPDVIAPDVFDVETDIFVAPKGQPGQNFATAAFRVGAVSIVIGAHLIIPKAVTAAALQDSPEFLDGAWNWTSSASENGVTITFTLLATPSGNGHDWSMLVSYDDGNGINVTDFELYTARTEDAGSQGSWSLYYPVEGVRTNVLNADFTRVASDDKELVFSIPQNGSANAGDSVRYAVDADERIFHWTQVQEQIEHLVTWSASTGEGHIEATNYNEGTRACWDAAGEDMDCPVSI